VNIKYETLACCFFRGITAGFVRAADKKQFQNHACMFVVVIKKQNENLGARYEATNTFDGFLDGS